MIFLLTCFHGSYFIPATHSLLFILSNNVCYFIKKWVLETCINAFKYRNKNLHLRSILDYILIGVKEYWISVSLDSQFETRLKHLIFRLHHVCDSSLWGRRYQNWTFLRAKKSRSALNLFHDSILLSFHNFLD